MYIYVRNSAGWAELAGVCVSGSKVGRQERVRYDVTVNTLLSTSCLTKASKSVLSNLIALDIFNFLVLT